MYQGVDMSGFNSQHDSDTYRHSCSSRVEQSTFTNLVFDYYLPSETSIYQRYGTSPSVGRQNGVPSTLECGLRGPWTRYRVYSTTVSLHCVLSRLRLRTVGILGDRLVRESVSVAKKASRGFPPPRCPEIMPPDSPGKTSEKCIIQC